MYRILFLFCVALVGTAAEVVPLPLSPQAEDFASDERKSVIPMPPGRGIVIVVEEELRWYGNDGALAHEGRTKAANQVRYTSHGFAYSSTRGDLVLVDTDEKETVISDLDQLQLHTDMHGNLRAISHLTKQGRILQLIEADPWRLNEQKHRLMFESDCIVIADQPLTLAQVERHHLDMHASEHIHLVRDGNVIWQSDDHKWRSVGILPSGQLVLLSSNQQAGEIAYVDIEGNLKIVAKLGAVAVANVIKGPNNQKGLVVAGDWRTPKAFRYRAFGEDGTLMHDFSRYGTSAIMIRFSHRILFLSTSENALVDPFSGEVLWRNQKESYFLAPGESPSPHYIVEQDENVAICMLFSGESPSLRIHPISDAKPSTYPVEGTGRWQFTGRDGSIWLYSENSIYQIKL